MPTTTLTEKTIHQLGGDDRRTRCFYSRLGADLAKRHAKAMERSLITEPVVEGAQQKLEKIEAALTELGQAKAKLEAEAAAARQALDQARAADGKSEALWAPVDQLSRLYPDVAAELDIELVEPDAEPPELTDYLVVWRRLLGPFELGPTDGLVGLADALRAARVPARLIERVLLRRRAWLDELRRADPNPSQAQVQESQAIGAALTILKTG